MNQEKQKNYPHDSEEEEGEILSSSSPPLRGRQINQNHDQIYESGSSEQDNIRIEEEKKKREDFWKNRNENKIQHPTNENDLLQYAYNAATKTNKRMLILRKRNEKRVEELERMRMMQQPYLVNSNTHFRGSINEYPIITEDWTGKQYYHPNNSLKISQSKLDQFIQKNISEETTSNYLNEVVKFENFAYQHRKKRRQNFQ